MINRRNLTWIFPLLLIVTFPVWQGGVAAFLKPRTVEDGAAAIEHSDQQDFVLENITVIQNHRERKTAEIRSGQAFTTDVPDELVMILVDADLYDDEGDLINVKAEKGVYNSRTRKLTLTTDVKVNRVSQDQQLLTDRLYYYDDRRIIETPGRTRLLADQAEILGNGLRYDVLTGRYTIGGRVSVVIGAD